MKHIFFQTMPKSHDWESKSIYISVRSVHDVCVYKATKKDMQRLDLGRTVNFVIFLL